MIAYLYPVRVMAIDDNIEFLKVLLLHLESHNFSIDTYSEGTKAEKVLQNYKENLNNSFTVQDGDAIGERSINVNISEIKNIYQDVVKKKELAVVIMDNSMPDKKGLEILKTVNNANLYKILLTGETEEQEIISAFNAGVIDGYVSKSSINLYEILLQQVIKGIKRYFTNKSNLLVKAIVDDKTRSTAVPTREYQEFIINFIQQYKIMEYYLLDSQGSIIMFGPEEKVYTLLILGDDNAQAHLDIAIEEGCSKKLLDIAKNQKGKIYSIYKQEENTKFLLLDEQIENFE
jgi:CheY-like chemotaxis protein